MSNKRTADHRYEDLVRARVNEQMQQVLAEAEAAYEEELRAAMDALLGLGVMW